MIEHHVIIAGNAQIAHREARRLGIGRRDFTIVAPGLGSHLHGLRGREHGTVAWIYAYGCGWINDAQWHEVEAFKAILGDPIRDGQVP